MSKRDRVGELLDYLDCRIADVRERGEPGQGPEARWQEERRLLLMKAGACQMLAAIIAEDRTAQ